MKPYEFENAKESGCGKSSVLQNNGLVQPLGLSSCQIKATVSRAISRALKDDKSVSLETPGLL